jgi:hypothetical protein
MKVLLYVTMNVLCTSGNIQELIIDLKFSYNYFVAILTSIACLLYSIPGISESYQMGIFRILAGILHLGNVGFASRDSDSCTIPVSSEQA